MEGARSNRTEKKKGRMPMTIRLLPLLKGKIRQADLDTDMKLLMWAVSTLAFYRAFRIHELLSKNEATYDPDHTLLVEDVKLRGQTGNQVLEISLKCPKEKKSGNPTVVDGWYEFRPGTGSGFVFRNYLLLNIWMLRYEFRPGTGSGFILWITDTR